MARPHSMTAAPDCPVSAAVRAPELLVYWFPGMDLEARKEMLRRDNEESFALSARLDTQPSGPLHGPESPQWLARDVYAHFARWINNSMDAFAAWSDGRRVIPPPAGQRR
jgi:hypothetical protein